MGKPIGSLAEQLRRAKRTLEQATARFDDEVERVAQVAALVDQIAAQLAPSLRPRKPVLDAASIEALKEAARKGADSLSLTWQHDGSAEVSIDDTQPFRLQPRTAHLLLAIAAPGGRQVGDGLTGWRSYGEVAAQLRSQGHGASVASVTQAVYRLRLALREARQNWFLVQTTREQAVRFVLKQRAAQHGSLAAVI